MNALEQIQMSMLYPLVSSTVAGAPKGDGHTVIVLPGFFTGPSHTLLLRTALTRAGYFAVDWGEGLNLGTSEKITQQLNQLLRGNYDSRGKVSLVGWSLGGFLARSMANSFPDLVRNVITLGSPHRADPRKSKLAPVFDLISPTKVSDVTEQDLDLIRKDPPVPLVNIYTKSDEVVEWQDCLSVPGPLARNVEVSGSHLMLTHNTAALRTILEALARPVSTPNAS